MADLNNMGFSPTPLPEFFENYTYQCDTLKFRFIFVKGGAKGLEMIKKFKSEKWKVKIPKISRGLQQ